MGKIIGGKVRTLCSMNSKGGTVIEKGEICTISKAIEDMVSVPTTIGR